MVSDLEESSKWYQELLGFKVSFSAEGYRVLSVGNGDSIPLTIEKGDINPRAQQSYPIFSTNDIKGTHEKLKQQGVCVGELNYDGVNTFFDFFDLDDNKLQICFFE